MYYCYTRNQEIQFQTVESVLSSHPVDQKLVGVQDNWLLREDSFYKECIAEGQKQTGSIRQMGVEGR
jgi:hypothetical protein